MQSYFSRLTFGLCFLIFFSCKISHKTTENNLDAIDDGLIEFTFLQLNDVYEIAPLEGGKVGGMARVATLYKQLKKENPNTFFVLAGDFLNPSLVGTMKYEGQRIKGRQMVEIMNACGIDLVVYGNHEFDIKEHELQARMNESDFAWLGTNVLQVKKDSTIAGGKYLVPFKKEKNGNTEIIPETYTWQIKDADGTTLKIGILGATIDKKQPAYVAFQDYKKEATKAYLELQNKTDLVIGLTHLEINQDLELAAQLPNVPLLMGGHDHHHMKYEVGNVSVTKADANAKSAYVHWFKFDKKTGKYSLNSKLVEITDQIADDMEVKALVDKWTNILNDRLATVYPTPNEIIFESEKPLDGREVAVRTQQTSLGKLFAASFAATTKAKADLAIMNGGSIRLDDQLEGKIQAIDIFRAMPFGGQVWEVNIIGSTLASILQIGLNEQYGKGGYLQTYNVSLDTETKTWMIGGKALNPNQIYHVAINDYLYTGSRSIGQILQKIPADKPTQGDRSDSRRDVRVAVIEYLKGLKK